MSSRFLYFAYGSNLYSERIRLANKTASFYSVALLQGYRLEFGYMSQRWKGAAANIIQADSNSEVYGVLWELDHADLQSLDNQEGVHDGIYERIQINVIPSGENKVVDCWVYKITKTTRDKAINEHGDKLKPSIIYKNVIIKGAKENQLPSDYIKFLENIPDNGYNGNVNIDLKV